MTCCPDAISPFTSDSRTLVHTLASSQPPNSNKMSIDPLDKDLALVLLNFQNGMVAGIQEPDAQAAIVNALDLISACRLYEKPIIFVTFNPFLGRLVTARCDEPMFPQGTDLPATEATMRDQGWFDLVEAFKPEENDIQLVKSYWDAFVDTDLELELSQRNITQLIICGLVTSKDIDATATSGINKGYNLVFPFDAMADVDTITAERIKTKKLPKIGQHSATQHLVTLIR